MKRHLIYFVFEINQIMSNYVKSREEKEIKLII